MNRNDPGGGGGGGGGGTLGVGTLHNDSIAKSLEPTLTKTSSYTPAQAFSSALAVLESLQPGAIQNYIILVQTLLIGSTDPDVRISQLKGGGSIQRKHRLRDGTGEKSL